MHVVGLGVHVGGKLAGDAAGELNRVRDPEIGRHPVDELAAGAQLRKVRPLRVVLREKRTKPQRASGRVGRVVKRVGGRIVRIERVPSDREERLVDVDVVVIEVRLVVEDAGASAHRGPAIGGRQPDEADARRHVVQILLHVREGRRAAERRDEPRVVRVDKLVARKDGVIDVVAHPEVERQVVPDLPGVLHVQAAVGMPFDVSRGSNRERQRGGIACRVVDVEHTVGGEAPPGFLRAVDVHVHRHARQLPAKLELMSSFHKGEAVAEIEIGLAFEAARHAGAEGGARVVLFRVQPAMRDVVDQCIAVLPRDIRRDDQLVHAVVQAGFVERAVAERGGPVRQSAPKGSVEGGALLERPVGRAVAAVAALTAAVDVLLDRAIVPQREPVRRVDVPVSFHDVRPSRIAGRNDRLDALVAPVVGNRQARRRAVVEAFDAGEIKQFARDDRAAEEPADPALTVGRRRVQEDRHVVGEVARVRRAVEAGILEEPVGAPLHGVRAAARNHIQDGARRVPELGREPVGHHLEFLNPILRERLCLRAVELHRIGRAVDKDVVLVLMLPGRRKSHRRPARGGDAWRQLGEIGEIAVDGRQVFDSRGIDERADDVLRLDQRGLAGDVHVLLNRADAEHDVDFGLLPDAQHDVRAPRGGEAGELHHELVGPRREAGQKVVAGRLGYARPRRIRLDVPHRDGRPG